jgi:beta-lactamase regulating signal transducer with metallopeptidase domain
MNEILIALSPLARPLSMALAHFLWQGAVVALIGGAILEALRHRPAALRYRVACWCLAVMMALPFLTTVLIVHHDETAPRTRDPLIAWPAEVRPATDHGTTAVGMPFLTASGAGAVLTDPSSARPARDLAPWVCGVWIAGVLALTGLHLAGWWRVQRWRRLGTAPAPAAWIETAERLRIRLGLSRAVRILRSAAVEIPTVVGVFRPIILMPICALGGVDSRHVESLLAHELAHIWRRDALVNLLQMSAETLLFYHPAVWWISGTIRQEREHCCDDIAIDLRGDRLGYARALLCLEQSRLRHPRMALGAGDGSLIRRIRRMAGGTSMSSHTPDRPLLAGALMALCLVIGVSVLALAAQDSWLGPSAHGSGFPTAGLLAAAQDDEPGSPGNQHRGGEEAERVERAQRSELAKRAETLKRVREHERHAEAEKLEGIRERERVEELRRVHELERVEELELVRERERMRQAVVALARSVERARAAAEARVVGLGGHASRIGHTGMWEDAAAGAPFEGRWEAEQKRGRVYMGLSERSDGRGGELGASLDRADLEDLDLGPDDTFTLSSEAGTITFTGDWERHGGELSGEGSFRFEPDARYIEAMADLGIRDLDAPEMLILALHDMTTDTVRALHRLGYDDLDRDDLVAFTIHDVSPEFVESLAEAGLRHLDKDELLAFRIHGITPAYVAELENLGFTGLDAEEIMAFKIHGVTAAFVQEMKDAGFDDLDAEELIACRIHGVSPGFVQDMRDMGFRDLELDDLLACRIHGVDRAFIQRLRDKGLEDLDLEDILKIKIHGIKI